MCLQENKDRFSSNNNSDTKYDELIQVEHSTGKKVADDYRNVFGCTEALVVRSPGRVNIIGEHTDYNNGFVLPAAIDKAIFVAVGKRTDGRVHLYSTDFNESFEVELACIQPTSNWATYVLGVAKQLIDSGYTIEGFNLSLDGNVPIGAGLSSSAAVECATVFALNELFDLGIDKLEMVKIAQKAEQTFSGVMCGIMDMFASMFGKKGHVIKLDCRSLDYEYRPFKLDGYKIVLFNTNVKHALAESAYNNRRQQCEQGVAWIKAFHPQVNSLRDVTNEMLEQHVAGKDGIVYRRCLYVIEEIQRVSTACKVLEKGDIHELGKQMFATHEGLRHMYEVSCKELDYLVDAVKGNKDVPGARMMGGGFGGCTINLVKEEAIEALTEKISAGYKNCMRLELTAHTAVIEDGTALL
jgi:galactokinase